VVASAISTQRDLIVRKACILTPIQLVLSYAKRYKLVLIITILSTLLLVGVQLIIPLIIRSLIADVTNLTVTPES
jgi:ABC-type multidrug transport system fused ATPase/permease subunit